MRISPTLLHWLAAGALYIGIGVVVPEFLFSSAVAIGYLLLTIWIIPAFLRTLWRRVR